MISPVDRPGLSNPSNAYTHAPALHPNLILGSLQLLAWLLFHPSAWRSYVARIDPALRPDFCLAELSAGQWRSPSLRRFLLSGFLVWPFIVSALASGVLWALGTSSEMAAAGVVTGIALGIVFCLWIGACANLAVIAGSAAGVVGIVALGVALSTAQSQGIVADSWESSAVLGPAVSVAFGFLGGAVGGVARSVADRETGHSMARQAGSIVIALGVGALFAGLAYWVSNTASGVINPVTNYSLLFYLFGGAIFGTALGIAAGWQSGRWRIGLLMGALVAGVFLLAGILIVFAYQGSVLSSGPGYDVGEGISGGTESASLFVVSYLLARWLAGPSAAAFVGALGTAAFFIVVLINEGDYTIWPGVPLGLVSLIVGLTLRWWLPIALYPLLAAWDLLLLRADEQRDRSRPALLRWHSAFWTEFQLLPLWELPAHLVLIAERNPAEGQIAIEYLAASRQAWAARQAQIELEARFLQRSIDVDAIRDAHRHLSAGELVGPASSLLRSFSRLSQDVDAALNLGSAYNQRLALSTCEERLDGLVRELVRSRGRYDVRFLPIAQRWRQLVADYERELAAAVELRGEIDSPYVVGVPLTMEQAIFVGRTEEGARIEQLLLDRRRPPLLLLGQRRMGKTSLLNNLGRLLPTSIVPLFVDLQGPVSQAADHAGFLYNLARGMARSAERQRSLALPALPRQTLTADPFTRFDEWLDEVEQVLGENTALLTLDEFEVLDSMLAQDRFQEQAVLGMLRHLIQHRPRFKVMLAGSHSLDELDRWASYLINVQMVPLGFLKEGEALQLIEQPVPDFALRYDPAASRRVLALTRGHPCLIQLVCSEVIAVKNDQAPDARLRVAVPDVEEAAASILVSGHLFFADIQLNQVAAGDVALLRFLAAQGEQTVTSRETLAHHFPADLEHSLNHLIRRELLEQIDGGYRFQVEVIRRWFAHAQEIMP